MRRIPGAFLAIPLLALSVAACTSGGDLPIGNTQTWARVRVANLAPDIPALDFCFALQGTGNWIGPQMKAMGETGGVAWRQQHRAGEPWQALPGVAVCLQGEQDLLAVQSPL